MAEVADWRIVAPWYRWQLKDVPDPERDYEAHRPALHKFVSSEFVDDFLADPQRSAVFADRDHVQDVLPVPGIPAPGAGPSPSISSLFHQATDIRKLFLPAHQRFYMVAVSIHCDQPGFPKVDPAKIAEVGMVIRRRKLETDGAKARTGAALVQEFAQSRAQARVSYALDVAKGRSRILHPFLPRHDGRVASPSAATVDAAKGAEIAARKLRAWAELEGIDYQTAGWVPTGEGSFGQWLPMDDEPSEVIERSYSMRRLHPNPVDPTHAAHDGTLFYASVPTGSDEITESGLGRFNELDSYEIRVFARLECGDCPGPIIWSAPSEKFRFASFYDPDGCAQRPLEIRLPSFSDLEASSALPSLRMTAPEGSSLQFSKVGVFPTGGGVKEDVEVCFFAIPLITIVALFLLNLILPIVLFVFGLWWMLKLKFCIPPSFEADLELAFEASADMSLELAVELDIDIDIDARVSASTRNQIETFMVDTYTEVGAPGDWNDLAGEFTPNALFSLAKRSGAGADPAASAEDDGAPNFSIPFTYRSPVSREQVVPPAAARRQTLVSTP